MVQKVRTVSSTQPRASLAAIINQSSIIITTIIINCELTLLEVRLAFAALQAQPCSVLIDPLSRPFSACELPTLALPASGPLARWVL